MHTPRRPARQPPYDPAPRGRAREARPLARSAVGSALGWTGARIKVYTLSNKLKVRSLYPFRRCLGTPCSTCIARNSLHPFGRDTKMSAVLS